MKAVIVLLLILTLVSANEWDGVVEPIAPDISAAYRFFVFSSSTCYASNETTYGFNEKIMDDFQKIFTKDNFQIQRTEIQKRSVLVLAKKIDQRSAFLGFIFDTGAVHSSLITSEGIHQTDVEKIDNILNDNTKLMENSMANYFDNKCKKIPVNDTRNALTPELGVYLRHATVKPTFANNSITLFVEPSFTLMLLNNESFSNISENYTLLLNHTVFEKKTSVVLPFVHSDENGLRKEEHEVQLIEIIREPKASNLFITNIPSRFPVLYIQTYLHLLKRTFFWYSWIKKDASPQLDLLNSELYNRTETLTLSSNGGEAVYESSINAFTFFYSFYLDKKIEAEESKNELDAARNNRILVFFVETEKEVGGEKLSFSLPYEINLKDYGTLPQFMDWMFDQLGTSEDYLNSEFKPFESKLTTLSISLQRFQQAFTEYSTRQSLNQSITSNLLAKESLEQSKKQHEQDTFWIQVTTILTLVITFFTILTLGYTYWADLRKREEELVKILNDIYMELDNNLDILEGNYTGIFIPLSDEVWRGASSGGRLNAIGYQQVYQISRIFVKIKSINNVIEQYKLFTATQKAQTIFPKQLALYEDFIVKEIEALIPLVNSGKEEIEHLLKRKLKYVKRKERHFVLLKDLWSSIGVKYVKEKDYRRAVECYENASEYDLSNLALAQDISELYSLMGNGEKALHLAKKSLELSTNPNDKCISMYLQIAALIVLHKINEAKTKLKELETLMQEGMIVDWNFSDFTTYIEKLEEEERRIAKKMLEILQRQAVVDKYS